jgi:iron complex transport system substrate-binding protein
MGAMPASADGPTRVVSINLCTDLMAMDLAPESLLAVSPLASDPTSSPLAEQARAFRATDGSAEDVFLLEPDLVLAGGYTERATVDLLRRMGIRVEVFAQATSLDDVRTQLERMGHLLDREAKAGAQLDAFDQTIASFGSAGADDVRVMAYFANGYSLGKGSLVGAVIEAAGLTNVAAEQGLTGGGRVTLEDLVLGAPDLIVTGERYSGSSRSEAILDHPALAAATGGRSVVVIPDRDWICGTTHIQAAVAALAQAAELVR